MRHLPQIPYSFYRPQGAHVNKGIALLFQSFQPLAGSALCRSMRYETDRSNSSPPAINTLSLITPLENNVPAFYLLFQNTDQSPLCLLDLHVVCRDLAPLLCLFSQIEC